jgi:adenylylsulfate kinase
VSEKNNNVVWHNPHVTRRDRERLNGHRSVCVWFTGLPSSGKSTIGHALERRLYELGCRTFVFDGDNVRHGLCSDLGFSRQDRAENIRRIGEMIKLFLEAGVIAITAFVSPFKEDREKVKRLVGGENFIEVYCRCPVEVCEKRDKKGHYQKARRGEIKEFTGISSPYEEPENPDIILDTKELSVEESVNRIMDILFKREILKIVHE